MAKLLKVFALGGNEISPMGKVDAKGKMINPDISSQWQRSAHTCKLIAEMVKKNPEHYYILAHGNGPQVGNILFRAEYARKVIHTIPLDICGADSQGGIGYMLGQILTNYLHINGLNKVAAETITQVVVDAQDPAFHDLTKFIGSGMTEAEAKERAKNEGFTVKMYKKGDDGKEVWRRVVASPRPLDIVEIAIIEAKLKAGILPIAVGGGGIPVVKLVGKKEGDEMVYPGPYGIVYKTPIDAQKEIFPPYAGVEAVIDKDLASALLGTTLLKRAQDRGEKLEAEFFIFTDVDGAKLNYQKPDQVDLRKLTVAEAEELMKKGAFPAGSMGPKIEAAISFVKGGGTRAFITRVDCYDATMEGKSGTVIIP